MAFISLMDDRIRAKGSRDPLGFESVWTSFGRRLVGNLTTVTSSWKNFAVALLGMHWCNELCRDVSPAEKMDALQAHFVRYEQLAAYLRCLDGKGDGDVLGITRVKKNLRDKSGYVRLGTSSDCQILSNQISYGLWGLYSSAMRGSELVVGDYRIPTIAGTEIAKKTEDHLDKTAFLRLLQGKEQRLTLNHIRSLQDAFLSAIGQPAVEEIMVDTLLRGSSNHNLQQALYETTKTIAREDLEGNIATYVGSLRQKTSLTELDSHLHDIQCVERLLVTSNILFDYCRRKDGERLDTVVENIAANGRFDYIPVGPDLDHCRYKLQLKNIRDALRADEIKIALLAMFELNRLVMADRNGAPWIEATGDGRLRVRVRSEISELRSRNDLENEWHHNYFLTSFARIAASAGS